MNCFTHRQTVAIGLCKSCGKALCPECLTERVNGLACKGTCEARVDMLNRMIDSNSQIVNAARSQVRNVGFFGILMGFSFLIFAVWTAFEIGGFISYLLGISGSVMTIFSILRLLRKQQYPQP